jgi:N-acetylmuramoyl-L-alanine amidase-like protein
VDRRSDRSRIAAIALAQHGRRRPIELFPGATGSGLAIERRDAGRSAPAPRPDAPVGEKTSIDPYLGRSRRRPSLRPPWARRGASAVSRQRSHGWPARLAAGATLAAIALGLPVVAPAAAAGVVPKPPIRSRPIPFPPTRRAEMAAYAERHYGLSTWRLRDPKVIVEHFTANDSYSATWNTFAADTPDPELHELPGDCAHFVVDRDGTIYQLVPLGTMCRHTVGLNYTAIGIEHVAQSDGEVLSDARQLAASLWLTLWLMQRFHIELRNVIGHNESLTSPYHHELVAAWRCQTHGDWNHVDMQIYRRALIRLARRDQLAIGSPPAPRPAPAGC